MIHIVCVCLCVQAFSLMRMQLSKHFIQVFRGPGLSRGRINPSGDKTMCTGNTHSSFNERERRGLPTKYTHLHVHTHYNGRLLVPWQRSIPSTPTSSSKIKPGAWIWRLREMHTLVQTDPHPRFQTLKYAQAVPDIWKHITCHLFSSQSIRHVKKTRQIASLHALCQR